MGFGLFKSETKVSVSTSFNRVIEDRLLPNSVTTGTLKGILKDSSGQLVENIMEDLVASIGIKGERMYRYGKNGYPFGAPTSHIYKSTQADGIVRAVLEGKEGRSLQMEYIKYGPLNRQHHGWQSLFDSYGYNPRTNELTTLSSIKGASVYLDSMQVTLARANLDMLTGTAFEQWGVGSSSGYTPLRPYSNGSSTVQTPLAVDPAALLDYLKVTVIWRAADGIKRESFNIPMPLVVEDQTPNDCVQVRYSYQLPIPPKPLNRPPSAEEVRAATVIKYFTYRLGTGTEPDLDNLFSGKFNEMGSFFPFGYFRYNRTPTSTDPKSSEYKAAVKLMKYLNLDYKAVNEAINANPQIDHVESAMLMMIVPAVSSDAVENRYLFDFFKGLYVQSGAVAVTDAQDSLISAGISSIFGNLTGNRQTSPSISMVIQDARFSTSLSMSGIYRRMVPGVIGKVGTHTSDSGMVTRQHSAILKGQMDENGQMSPDSTITWTTSSPGHYYRKQVTSQMYEEIQVTDLRNTFNVWGGYTTSNSMIPIDHAISEQMPLPMRERLYARSLHYVFNSKQETKVKWYQQGWFGTFLIVVAIAWTIFSMGTDGGSGLAAAIAAGTATLEMIVTAIIVAGVEYVAYSLVAKLFVKLLGPEAAMLFAVAMAAYGVAAYMTSAQGSFGSMLAKDLLSVSNSMMTSISESYTKSLELIKTDLDQFNLFSQNKMDELKQIQDELEGSKVLSPFVLFGESPSAYFDRTVHAGNIGMASIDAVSSYCDFSLNLSKLNQFAPTGQLGYS